jgi:phage gpG-like protein
MKVTVKRDTASLDSVTKKLANPKDFLDLVGQMMLQEAHNRIQKTKRDPDGNPWAPWASSTARARRLNGTAGTGLLYITGRLDQSLTYSVQGPKVSVQTSNPYARYLQNGTSKMRARPFLGFGRVEEDNTTRIWDTWINSKD